MMRELSNVGTLIFTQESNESLDFQFHRVLLISVWDRRQQRSVFSLKEMEDFVSSMLTNDDKMFLVCASGDGTLTTINMRTKKLHVRVSGIECLIVVLDFISMIIGILFSTI